MKQLVAACMVLAGIFGVSCERHSWEETKPLHQPHGGHGSGHGGEGSHEQVPAGGHGGEEMH